MKTALVLLALDEIDGLTKLWDALPLSAASEAFAVDGGSTDGTVAFLKSKGMKVVSQERRGRGAAMKAALAASDAEAFCFFSPDGNEDPADAPRLLKLVEDGADLAIASRMMPGAVNEEDVSWWRPRKWVCRAFTAAANLAWQGAVTDAGNGLRACRRSVFDGLDEDGFAVEYRMTIRAFKSGLKVVELPTREGQRLGGRSKARSWATGRAYARALTAEMFRD